jgi:hypothetical protein
MRYSQILLCDGYDDVDSSHISSTCILIGYKQSNLYTTGDPFCFYVSFQTLSRISNGGSEEFFSTKPASGKTLS